VTPRPRTVLTRAAIAAIAALAAAFALAGCAAAPSPIATETSPEAPEPSPVAAVEVEVEIKSEGEAEAFGRTYPAGAFVLAITFTATAHPDTNVNGIFDSQDGPAAGELDLVNVTPDMMATQFNEFAAQFPPAQYSYVYGPVTVDVFADTNGDGALDTADTVKVATGRALFDYLPALMLAHTTAPTELVTAVPAVVTAAALDAALEQFDGRQDEFVFTLTGDTLEVSTSGTVVAAFDLSAISSTARQEILANRKITVAK
jgi:hypothetical protein